MRIKNWPILAKSLSQLAMLGALCIVAAIFAAMNMKSIDDKYSLIISGPEKAIADSTRANRGLVGASRDIYRMAIATDPADIATAQTMLDADKGVFGTGIDRAASEAPDRKADLDRFKGDGLTALSDTCASTLRYSHSTDPADVARAATAMNKECAPALEDVSNRMAAFNTQFTADLDKQSDETTRKTNSTIVMTCLLIFGGLVVVAILSVWMTLTSLVRPVKALTGAMSDMSKGRLDVVIAGQDSADEIGQMSRAAESFRVGLAQAAGLREQAETQKVRAETERKATILKFADDFEKSVGGIVNLVSSAATEMQAAASQLTATAQETSAQSIVVSAAAEEAGANVTSVASSAEELGASVGEIGRQVETSSGISASAVREAQEAVEVVGELDTIAAGINEVVQMISGLASQTNLLALNATIESARAGEAGKGFAVVASEVKALAGQTAKATTDISARITQIQDAAYKASGSIKAITGTIGTIDSANSAIASAIQQQSAATTEIVHAVHQASIGTHEVTSNMAGVAQAAEQTGQAAVQLLSSSSELSQQAANLHTEVDRFLATIRAA